LLFSIALLSNKSLPHPQIKILSPSRQQLITRPLLHNPPLTHNQNLISLQQCSTYAQSQP